MNQIALILMIKNEERILLRCLQALEGVVDYYCIADTGSTDASVEIANGFLKTHKGCVNIDEWKNFGHNRTVSFRKAYDYLRTVDGCDLSKTYGLLLDADMIFVPGRLRQTILKATGYKMIQKNGGLEYMNARLLRMDFPWKCTGVTHEYWDGSEVDGLEMDVCYIDDKNDGGSKHDKFERDRRLLEDGVKDEPTNVRYMFYLAQTYSCLNMISESIKWYKKRIQAGGWYEEVWYSYYSIGELYKRAGNIIKFEQWMLKAFDYRKERAESIYKLAEHFRSVGQNFKAYHYIKLGMEIPYPHGDGLFIEANVYNGLFHYEASIVEYYVLKDKNEGLKSSMKAMMNMSFIRENIVQNIQFYVTPLVSTTTPLQLSSPFDTKYRPSAISLHTYPFANVRFVNYWMANGDYKTENNENVDTQNAYMNLETGEVLKAMKDEIGMTKHTTNVKGLEDVRLYEEDGLHFTATSVYEYMEGHVCTLHGDYNKETGEYENVVALKSPYNRQCEKNWCAIPGTGMFVYDWYPLRIGSVAKSSLKIQFTLPTPPIFEMFRGSAPLIPSLYAGVNGQIGWIALVHFVEYSKPRKYYHCLIELESSYKPVRISMPFVFRSPSVEYCISFRGVGSALEFYVSFMDSNPCKVTVNWNEFQWISM
jgi:glycosyltransferase involved in cell wall biosynthesis